MDGKYDHLPEDATSWCWIDRRCGAKAEKSRVLRRGERWKSNERSNRYTGWTGLYDHHAALYLSETIDGELGILPHHINEAAHEKRHNGFVP